MCMNILIPAAGKGTRFKGFYDQPKNLIDVKGEPMLVAAARSLGLEHPDNKFIFLLPEDMMNDTHKELGERLIKEFPGCTVLVVVGHTEGAAQTAIQAVQYIENDEELFTANAERAKEMMKNLNKIDYEQGSRIHQSIVLLNSIKRDKNFLKRILNDV